MENVMKWIVGAAKIIAMMGGLIAMFIVVCALYVGVIVAVQYVKEDGMDACARQLIQQDANEGHYTMLGGCSIGKDP